MSISIGCQRFVWTETSFPCWSNIESDIDVERFGFRWDFQFPNEASDHIIDSIKRKINQWLISKKKNNQLEVKFFHSDSYSMLEDEFVHFQLVEFIYLKVIESMIRFIMT
jgi:hypothetical protein